jgi:hypothetical protein
MAELHFYQLLGVDGPVPVPRRKKIKIKKIIHTSTVHLKKIHFHYAISTIVAVSVGDPHVFGPPKSGSISQRYGSRSGSGSSSRSFPFLRNVLKGLK